MKKPTRSNTDIDDDPLAGDMSDFISKAKWIKTSFVFAANDATVTIRMPKALVAVARKVAKKRGIKYHRMMRDAIVSDVLKAA